MPCCIYFANYPDHHMNLLELLAQRAEVEKRIAALQGESRAEAIAKIRVTMAENGLTMADIGGDSRKKRATDSGSAPAAERAPVVVKYCNAAGETWAGRGKRPRWLQAALAGGATLESFLVQV